MSQVCFHKQHGYALLVASSLILIGLSITTLVATKSMYFEQKSQRDQYYQRIAFQAAEAGLEHGLGHFYNNQSTILQDSNNDGFINIYTNAAISDVALSSSSGYTVTYTNTIAYSYKTIEITSTGFADNGDAKRTLRELVTIYPILTTPPPASMVVKGSTTLNGNIVLTNNQTNFNIWSGGAVSLTGSATTATSSGTASRGGALDTDVMSNDAGLSALSIDQFFNDFFSQTKAQVKENANLTYNNSSTTNMSAVLDGINGQSIWLSQTSGVAAFNSNISIGSLEQPVVLIVDGPVQINAVVTIYGVVYIAGTWSNSGAGTLNVVGGIIAESNLVANGILNVNYNQTVFDNLDQVGHYAKVPGSWRDF